MDIVTLEVIINENQKKDDCTYNYNHSFDIYRKCSFDELYTPQNQSYVEKIIHQDSRIKEKFGDIKSYKTISSGQAGKTPTDDKHIHFTVNVEGTKKLDRIVISLYKDENGKLLRYSVR